jgi:hypothetical protein
MSVTSICQVCESATANYTCGSCGATVCADHYDQEKGLCSLCLSGTQM